MLSVNELREDFKTFIPTPNRVHISSQSDQDQCQPLADVIILYGDASGMWIAKSPADCFRLPKYTDTVCPVDLCKILAPSSPGSFSYRLCVLLRPISARCCKTRMHNFVW